MSDGVYMLPPTPERIPTLLYGIEPGGWGTGQVESLYSYLLSLAYAHRLSPDKLVTSVLPNEPDVNAQLTPRRTDRRFMQAKRMPGWGWGWGWDKNAGRSMLGASPSAGRWAEALSAATGLPGLARLNFSLLEHHIAPELITAKPRICLACLADDHASGRMPYERLLWRMNCVSCCPTHRALLVDARCGSVARTARREINRVRLGGVCGRCGSIGYRCRHDGGAAACDGEVWRARQCEELIAELVHFRSLGADTVKLALRALVKNHGNQAALAAQADLPKSVLCRLLNSSSAKMSLGRLLNVAAVDGLSVVELLQGRLRASGMPGAMRDSRYRRRVVAKADHDAIRMAMQTALAKEFPPSLTDLARDLRVDVSTLARHEDIYKQLHARRQRVTALAMKGRHQQAAKDAAYAFLAAQSAGLSPTLQNVRSRYGDKWMPSTLQAKALALIRLRLGCGNLADPGLNCRLSRDFVAEVDVAVQLIRARRAELPGQPSSP